MIEGKIESVFEDFLYLITCGLHGTAPEQQRIESMDLPILFALAKGHALSAVTYMALETAESLPVGLEEWKEKKEKAIRKTILLDIQRQDICRAMEEEKIWHLPLKGVVLKERYPKIGMREMSDNDILYDAAYSQKVHEIMVKQGFKPTYIGKGNHDVYKKKPIYNFEMHRALYGGAHEKEWVDYYRQVKERLIPDQENSCSYHFTDEDFYIYMVTHACKHYKSSGTGIRSLLDTYVYLREKEPVMNWSYIHGELTKLQVEDFEEKCRQTAKKIFCDAPCLLMEEEKTFLRYIFESGTYGTMKNHVTNELKEYQSNHEVLQGKAKRRYLWQRLFPGEKYYQTYAPYAYRHRWFRPFFLLYRVVRGIFCNSRKIIREVWIVIKTG